MMLRRSQFEVLYKWAKKFRMRSHLKIFLLSYIIQAKIVTPMTGLVMTPGA